MTKCTGLFAHSLDKLETVDINKEAIAKRCKKCGYQEILKHSNRQVIYMNTLVHQKKKWASEDNAKELLQPLNHDGSVNDDFTEAFGYNPFDDKTKELTPRLQGGLAK